MFSDLNYNCLFKTINIFISQMVYLFIHSLIYVCAAICVSVMIWLWGVREQLSAVESLSPPGRARDQTAEPSHLLELYTKREHITALLLLLMDVENITYHRKKKTAITFTLIFFLNFGWFIIFKLWIYMCAFVTTASALTLAFYCQLNWHKILR